MCGFPNNSFFTSSGYTYGDTNNLFVQVAVICMGFQVIRFIRLLYGVPSNSFYSTSCYVYGVPTDWFYTCGYKYGVPNNSFYSNSLNNSLCRSGCWMSWPPNISRCLQYSGYIS